MDRQDAKYIILWMGDKALTFISSLWGALWLLSLGIEDRYVPSDEEDAICCHGWGGVKLCVLFSTFPSLHSTVFIVSSLVRLHFF